jgi:hypothetical protein
MAQARTQSPLTRRLIMEGCEAPISPPVVGLAAAWRRGIMHAVERLDLALATKGSATARIAAVQSALDDLTELQRAHAPATYSEAFAICAADHAAQRKGRAA